jgi:hypothetical protein
MKRFLRLLSFLFIWFLVWSVPLLVGERVPIVKKICQLPEWIIGTGLAVLVGIYIEEHYRKKKSANDAYGREQATGQRDVLDADLEQGAGRKGQAVIAVSGLPGSQLRLPVSIDGQPVGEARPWLANEFIVEPGKHTVAVSMAWFRSRPAMVLTEPGCRAELKIAGSSWAILKCFLPILVCAVAAASILGGLRLAGAFDDPSPRWLLAISVGVFGGCFLVVSVLLRDYWAVWTLERVSANPAKPGEPEPSVAGDGGPPS